MRIALLVGMIAATRLGFYDSPVRYELQHDGITLIVGQHMFQSMVDGHYCKRITVERSKDGATHICFY